MSSIKFQSFEQDDSDQVVPFEVFGDVKKVSFEYDNGRLIVYVDDSVFYQNLGAGNDFSVSIRLGKE